ncbi:hypothetical protein [Actinokineospora globicatena]|uniref:hypothetical protein n=1 Tax=Actinokineospora globicatena TaxID=103729 RepID=UPI0020A599FE|nr:hypothetical protein [Actinokineospora globicatena]MCP2303239.1 hypothetical protein [Actinokineospora globicatena]GLW79635.1 hypothetical protein Aglo01_41160 [Actinokineospora globicatena]GLW85955.1 hypothetical protein Aglo02_35950 [Actinokineospora globicatena]
MAIDPAHLPIFGDPEPVDAPAPVRAAMVLLLLNVGLTAAHLAVVSARTDHDVSLSVVPICLAMGFALCVRSGRDWARVASLLVAGLALLLMLGIAEGVLGTAALVLSTLLVVSAAHLMYRTDVRDYFVLGDDTDLDGTDSDSTDLDGADSGSAGGAASADVARGSRTPPR